MRPFTHTTDPEFNPPKEYSSFNKFWLKYIRDQRDLPFVHLTLKITLTLIPLSILLYFNIPTWVWWSSVVIHFYINNKVFKGPFGLMLHCTSHKPLFKSKYNWLNNYLPWVIGPFFGQTPETFLSHHLGMHHVENNQEEDLSSTMKYQRDSFKDFMIYFTHFFFKGLYTLLLYFDARNIKKLRNRALLGELSFVFMVVLLSFISLKATVVVFIVPFFISRLIMMLGNFTQHAFVCAAEPDNHYKNSITCINAPYNHECWNDGYHTSHHIRPSMHWTKHPEFFRNHLNEYSENKALVFEGIGFLPIFWYVMNKRYDVLAKHLVNINNTFSSEEEAIELMKLRTKKIEKHATNTNLAVV